VSHGLLTLASLGESKYWEFEATGRYLASEHRDLTVSYVRSHSTRDLNDYDQFYGAFRNPIIRPNENSLSPTDVPNRIIVRGVQAVGGKWVFYPLFEWRTASRGRWTSQTSSASAIEAAGCRSPRRWTSRWSARGNPGNAVRRGAQGTTLASKSDRDVKQHHVADYGTFYNPIKRSIRFVRDAEIGWKPNVTSAARVAVCLSSRRLSSAA
jgi:hypothetical protein